MNDPKQAPSTWYALCAAGSLDHGAIHRTELHGEGLVVWRADDGRVNVWEDRCPHRGVQLSLGHHRGDTLQCQYHGWRFASGEGACRKVPAHPQAGVPPIRVTTWPALEQHGFVWTCRTADATTPALPAIDTFQGVPTGEVGCAPLRTTTIDADLASVRRALTAYVLPGGDAIEDAGECATFEGACETLTVESLDGAAASAIFVLQPVRAGKTCVHGIVTGNFDAAQRLALQHAHQSRLNALRDTLEAQADTAAQSPAAPLTTPLVVTKPLVRVDVVTRVVTGVRGTTQAMQANREKQAERTEHDEDRPFTVHLARSGGSVDVSAQTSLLDALRSHGVDVPTSCEQGVCGTCLTPVLDGEPLHRDAWLDARERAAGDCMLVCVSRARTPTLTLDL